MRTEMRPAALTYHAAVSAEGVLRASTHPGQEVELEADKVEVILVEVVVVVDVFNPFSYLQL